MLHPLAPYTSTARKGDTYINVCGLFTTFSAFWTDAQPLMSLEIGETMTEGASRTSSCRGPRRSSRRPVPELSRDNGPQFRHARDFKRSHPQVSGRPRSASRRYYPRATADRALARLRSSASAIRLVAALQAMMPALVERFRDALQRGSPAQRLGFVSPKQTRRRREGRDLRRARPQLEAAREAPGCDARRRLWKDRKTVFGFCLLSPDGRAHIADIGRTEDGLWRAPSQGTPRSGYRT